METPVVSSPRRRRPLTDRRRPQGPTRPSTARRRHRRRRSPCETARPAVPTATVAALCYVHCSTGQIGDDRISETRSIVVRPSLLLLLRLRRRLLAEQAGGGLIDCPSVPGHRRRRRRRQRPCLPGQDGRATHDIPIHDRQCQSAAVTCDM